MNAIMKYGKCDVSFADETPDDPSQTQEHEPCPLCGSTLRIVDVGPMEELVNYEDFRFRQQVGRTPQRTKSSKKKQTDNRQRRS